MAESKTKPDKISLCDIMKNNTSDIIQSMECQMPVIVQKYSDLYTQYLHMLDDASSACYVAEKEFFDKLNIDQGVLRQIQEFSETMKKNHIQNVEMSTKMFDAYVKMRISTIKSFDTYLHILGNIYAQNYATYRKFLQN
ncbi:hypothetical protein [Nitrosopumilus sp.]|uniref:hypothetical protein n=1 Tax=Nitrosopumilus sp. TaxID=2024843 RepID=UPI002619EDA9|nr:hypothetical protein [Nitrosopumilus sp.]